MRFATEQEQSRFMFIPLSVELDGFYITGKDAAASYLQAHPHATAEELSAWLLESAPGRLPLAAAQDTAKRIAERMLRPEARSYRPAD
jgi:hypothetical protein